MKKLKNFIKFLWEGLYNKRSILVVNIYNLISTAWITYITVDMFKHPHEECLGHAGAIFLTLFLNVFVYFICHIAFIIQSKKNWVIKDNPIIENALYRVISILAVFVAYFHYLLFVVFLLCYLVGRL